MFLFKMSCFIATKIGEKNVGSIVERLSLGTMIVSQLLSEVATRNDGFGEFGAIGSMHEKCQKYFLDRLWEAVDSNLGEFATAVDSYYPNITEDIRPYMTKSATPNIFSFPHLVYQSLVYDFVYPLLCCITNSSLNSQR
jgi:hypothetical protein